jgi:hypothetical protein
MMHKQLRLSLAAVVVVLGGCSSQPASQTTTTATATGAAANSGEVHLTLADFQLVDDHGTLFSMSADGTVTTPRGKGGQVHADGSVTGPDGTAHGKLSSTGSLLDAQGVERATITEDGTATVGGKQLHFGDDGKLVGGNPGESVQLKTSDPKVRRTAMLLLIMMESIGGEAGGSPK